MKAAKRTTKEMNWESIILYSFTGILISLILFILNKYSAKIVNPSKNGVVYLKMNRLYLFIGWICIIACIVVLFLAAFSQEQGILLIVISILMLIGGLGLAMLLWYQNHNVKYDDLGITVQDWKGDINEMKWSQILSARFKLMSGYIILKGLTTELKIHQHIVGLKSCLDKLDEKTTVEFDRSKLPSPLK